MAPEPIARTELEGAADLEFVDALLDATERLSDEVPTLSASDRMMFALAVCEIATNVAEHATPRTPGEVRLRVELTIDDHTMQAVFVDTGHPAALDLAGVEMADDEDESGRGLAMVRATVDELSHHPSGGNTWRILRRRRSE